MPVAAAKQVAPDVVKVGKKNICAVFLSATEAEKKAGQQGRVIEFSDQEAVVLKAFLTNHNYEFSGVDAVFNLPQKSRSRHIHELHLFVVDIGILDHFAPLRHFNCQLRSKLLRCRADGFYAGTQ